MSLGVLLQWLSLASINVGACIFIVKIALSVRKSFDDYKTQSLLTDQRHTMLIESMDRRITLLEDKIAES